MTVHERAPSAEEESEEESEEQQDEEAEERFDDESLASEPNAHAVGKDLDGTPLQANREA